MIGRLLNLNQSSCLDPRLRNQGSGFPIRELILGFEKLVHPEYLDQIDTYSEGSEVLTDY